MHTYNFIFKYIKINKYFYFKKKKLKKSAHSNKKNFFFLIFQYCILYNKIYIYFY